MNSTKPVSGRFFDDVSRLMTNAVGVAQGARDEAETAMKGWVDRWLADRNLVTRDEFEAVREMAIKARTDNAELRALISAMTGTEGRPHGAAAGASSGQDSFGRGAYGQEAAGQTPAATPHVSAAQAPASGAMGGNDGANGAEDRPGGSGAATPDAPHVSEADAPASGAMGGSGGANATESGLGGSGAATGDAPHLSEADAPASTAMPDR